MPVVNEIPSYFPGTCDGSKPIPEPGGEGENFDETERIGGSVRLDDEDRVEQGGDAQDGIGEAVGVLTADATCGEALYFRAEVSEGMGINGGVLKVIEDDVGSTRSIGDAR